MPIVQKMRKTTIFHISQHVSSGSAAFTSPGIHFRIKFQCKFHSISIPIFWGSQNVFFRVQTVILDRIAIDFWRSRKHLHDSDLPKAKNQKSDHKFDQSSKTCFYHGFLIGLSGGGNLSIDKYGPWDRDPGC